MRYVGLERNFEMSFPLFSLLEVSGFYNTRTLKSDWETRKMETCFSTGFLVVIKLQYVGENVKFNHVKHFPGYHTHTEALYKILVFNIHFNECRNKHLPNARAST